MIRLSYSAATQALQRLNLDEQLQLLMTKKTEITLKVLKVVFWLAMMGCFGGLLGFFRGGQQAPDPAMKMALLIGMFVCLLAIFGLGALGRRLSKRE